MDSGTSQSHEVVNRTARLHPDVRIGHVHLKVADIDRALTFWRDLLGFEIQQRFPGAVFLSAGGYHHHIALNIWGSRGGAPPPAGSTGLYHVAILFPDRRELAKVLKRVIDADYPITGASDHGVSEAIYLDDPDGNGVELYRDRSREEWPRDTVGNLMMMTDRLDIDDLLLAAQ